MAQVLLRQGIPFLFSSGYSTVGLPPEHSDRPFLVKPFYERELGPIAAGLLRPNPATMGSALAPEVLSAIGLQLQSAAVFATGAFGRTCEASAARPLALPFPPWSSSRRSIDGRLLRQRPIARTRLHFAKDDNRSSHRADTELGLRRMTALQKKALWRWLSYRYLQISLSPPGLVASRDVNDEGGVGPGYIAGAAPFPPLILAAMDEPLRSVRVFREYVVDG
ncbi:MAG TPA: hypothetical protein VK681_39780 [Reyranella sp.]|nr:hypothetical protein [Reyranella sp.]